MTIDLLSQLWVTVFGLSAIGCSLCTSMRRRRAGVVFGLLGQPAWYVQLVLHEQWGMLPVFCGYTALWLFGLWNLWLRRAPDAVAMRAGAMAIRKRRPFANENPSPAPKGPPPVSQVKP